MSNNANPPEVEGYESSSGSGWGEYPLDSVFVRQEIRSLSDVIDRIKRKRYILDPEFQRDFVWSPDKQSKLIESSLMRIPLPVFYVAEAKDGRIIVVDGLQRLTTFSRYCNNEFPLKGLSPDEEDGASELNGRFFNDLPIPLQERILDTQIILYILDPKAPDRAKLDIFERVNSGVPINRQQMRNALYTGPATRWLTAAAEDPIFIKVTGGTFDPKTMRDREAINRFCSFFLIGWSDYRGDMDGFLATALDRMNEMNDSQRTELRKRFNRSMSNNWALFNKHSFRKSLSANKFSSNRTVLNIAMFDVFSTFLARIDDVNKYDDDHLDRLRESAADIVQDPMFSSAITNATNTRRSVIARFRMGEVWAMTIGDVQ
jgi:hypothetical protein